MKRMLISVALAGCACGAKKPTGTGPGTGSPSASAVTCADATANVTALYQAEAKATDQATHDPTFVDDNVAMVMKDCAADPVKVAPCAKSAPSVAELETKCLIPLDEEGTEGGKTP
jgi:hypothetical protein